MKICFKCKISKPKESFYVHPRMADGRLGKCKECNKADAIATRNKKIEYYRQYDTMRSSSKGRLESNRIRSLEYTKKNKEKRHAHGVALNAFNSGKIIRKNCEHCGNEKSVMHHPDYTRPLYVIWLCTPCHARVHVNLKKEKTKVMSDLNKIRAIILHAAKEIVALLEVPPPVLPDLERQEFLREPYKAIEQAEAEAPKKRGRPAKSKGVEPSYAQVTICSPEPAKEPEIQPHHHELAAALGGTVESLTPEDLGADFDGNNPDHKAIVSAWAKEAAVDSQWKRCYADHIFKQLLPGKKTGEVYAVLDQFWRDLNAGERLNAHYQKNIVGK